eukprot:5174983-Alexandrium_andersonii.AAC.1
MAAPSDDLAQAIRLLTQQIQGLQRDVSALQAGATRGPAPVAQAAEQLPSAPVDAQPVKANKGKKGKNKGNKSRKEADALGTALGKVLERAQVRGTSGTNLSGAIEK